MEAPIIYLPDLIHNPNQAFNILWKDLNWLRIDNTPRYEYYHARNGQPYTYGRGAGVRTYQSQPSHPIIEEIWEFAEKIAKTKFDVVFLNGYVNQTDHLGWHSDDSPEMDDGRPIAIVSLGAEREIWFRKTRRLSDIDFSKMDAEATTADVEHIDRLLLQNGSLCLMSAGMQDTHQHRIPKANKIVGQRISLTFRGIVSNERYHLEVFRESAEKISKDE